MLGVRVKKSELKNTVTVAGELDIANVCQFEGYFANLWQEPGQKALEIDLTDLEFIDSTGVRSLMTIISQARQRSMQIGVVNVRPFVYEVLSTIGVIRLFGSDIFQVIKE